ncbi:GPW/gp25 family protein [Glaciimonas sp. GG7]
MADNNKNNNTAQFLGTGWTFPPTFERSPAQVRMSSDDLNIRQCLWVLFSTTIGERIMLATYGSSLGLRVFDALTTTMANTISSNIQKAILDWEPRIDVTNIDIKEMAPQSGGLTISIDYIVRQTNSLSMVFPFYLTEATLALPPL